jgi:hypothetical protein
MKLMLHFVFNSADDFSTIELSCDKVSRSCLFNFLDEFSIQICQRKASSKYVLWIMEPVTFFEHL